MSNKSKVLILFIGAVFVCGAGALVLALVALSNLKNDTENDTPQNETPAEPENSNQNEDQGNIITIGNGESRAMHYAVINNEDNLVLYSELGTPFTIQLESNNWSDIRWSPDNSMISVLGMYQGVDNLFLYDISKTNGEWITNYNVELQETGVTSYQWIDIDTLVYMQGEQENSWLHRYSVKTGQERLKVTQIDATIVSTRTFSQNLLLKSGGGYIIYNIVNNDQFDVTVDLNNESNQAILFSDESVLLLVTKTDTNDFTYTKIDYSRDQVDTIENITNVISLCNNTKSTLLGYSFIVATNQLRIVALNIKTDELEVIDTYTVEEPSLVLGSFSCTDEESVIFANREQSGVDEDVVWYITGESDLVALSFLENSLEVSVKNP